MDCGWLSAKGLLLSGSLLFIITSSGAQAHADIAFVSDTQAPMWIEKVFLKPNQNERATGLIMEDIVHEKPKALFILGDVVALGYKNNKWKNMDDYLAQCRGVGIKVTALLGNHDVMLHAKKGEKRFQSRFPDHVRTGYFRTVDSIAIILLNSNFKKMSKEAIAVQDKWLMKTLNDLDGQPGIQAIIVTCHHAPYTNSKIVGSSGPVQEHFVQPFIKSKKACLFITGHAHAFEHFKKEGKDFITIGGGGGIHQPLNTGPDKLEDFAVDYKPMFHYVKLYHNKKAMTITSFFLREDFSGMEKGNSFDISFPSRP